VEIELAGFVVVEVVVAVALVGSFHHTRAPILSDHIEESEPRTTSSIRCIDAAWRLLQHKPNTSYCILEDSIHPVFPDTRSLAGIELVVVEMVEMVEWLEWLVLEWKGILHKQGLSP
jgi:hypothetical protein